MKDPKCCPFLYDDQDTDLNCTFGPRFSRDALKDGIREGIENTVSVRDR